MSTSTRAARCGAPRCLAPVLALVMAGACGGGGGDGPVGPSTALSIASVSPSVLGSGGTVTITGNNFAGVATSNTVTVDGLAATVTSATTTQIVATIPTLPCSATHSAQVSVSSAAGSASVAAQVRGATAIDATAGAALVLSPAQARCGELPAASGQYLLSVVNLASSPTSTATFRLAGDAPAGTSASLMGAPSVLRQTSDLSPAPSRTMLGRGPGVGGPDAERMHDLILESNRAAYSRLRGTRLDQTLASSRSRRTTATGASRNVVAAPPAVGDLRAFRVAQFSTAVGATGGCSDFVDITARVVYVGTRSIVYEDVAAPLAKQMDTYYRAIGQEFDQAMYVVDSTYFGDPLRTDVDTDNDGHLNMVFTPTMTTGVAGFVISCDFFARDTLSNKVSNLGENFYAVTPTDGGTGFGGNTADNWLRGMRHTIVHEVKHIASFGARLENKANSFDESWLEEGTARHSEELWERNFIYHVAWKGNTGYRASLYCDVRPSFAECAGAPVGMFNHFATLYDVLVSPGASSVFGRVADGDFKFYASAWSFVRYTIDRYAADEATFLRAITQATTTRGMASIAAASGQDASLVFSRWTLSLYTDGIVSGSPDLDLPTWNTRDIFTGMNRDFPTNTGFPRAFPLAPTVTSTAAFSIDNAGIHGGSFAEYLVPANATAGRLIRLSTTTGAADVPATFRLAVARVP